MTLTRPRIGHLPHLRPIRLAPDVPIKRRRALWPVLVAAALAAGIVVVVESTNGVPTYPVSAVFSTTPGLFPGAAVNLLGVRVGTVTSVRNVGDAVTVGMRLQQSQPLPAGAIASFESPALLGEPDIELSPGYAGGPRLAPGAVIPESRTTEPVSTDQVLKDLATTLRQLDPHAVGQLVTNLAQDLNGEGAPLHQLITGAAGTLRLLAAKGDDLGQLNGTLAQLTGSLDSRTGEIQSLIENYDTVSGVIAGHSTQLSDAINQLTTATTDLVNLLTPDLGPLEQDIGTITTAGRTIDRNIPNVDVGLGQSVLLFSAAGRSYDPSYNWINLNNQLPPGVTGDYIAGLVRDRLAGVCRRILANHSTGLSSTEISTLAACGNPSSGFFDPILSNVASVLSTTNSSPQLPPSPLSLLQQGMNEIPGAGGTPSTPSKPSTGHRTKSTPAPPSTTTTTTTTTPSQSCVLLVFCQAAANPAAEQQRAQSATYTVPAPSLTAPAAKLLPPMPGTRRPHPASHRHHRHPTKSQPARGVALPALEVPGGRS
jgi:virulence factor Mce-like protein